VGDAVQDTTLHLSTLLQNITVTFDSVYAIVRGTDLHSIQLAVPSSSGLFVARNYSIRQLLHRLIYKILKIRTCKKIVNCFVRK